MLILIEKNDLELYKRLLPRLDYEEFLSLVASKKAYRVHEEGKDVGLIFYVLLWEKFPFIEHLIIEENFRNRGYGGKALSEFEKLMKEKGYKMLLLSTQVDEKAQFLYRRLGYLDCGGLVLENTPYDQPFELFMKKNLN